MGCGNKGQWLYEAGAAGYVQWVLMVLQQPKGAPNGKYRNEVVQVQEEPGVGRVQIHACLATLFAHHIARSPHSMPGPGRKVSGRRVHTLLPHHAVSPARC